LDKRRQAVLDEIHGCLKDGEFGEQAAPFIDDNLLATVTNLVEYPVGVSGRFDERFLALPDEVLITSMREHQKYFSDCGWKQPAAARLYRGQQHPGAQCRPHLLRS
jgi:glycyl-tRNA synthetase beta chain